VPLKKSARSDSSQRHCAAELAKVDTYLNDTDSGADGGAARVNTPASLLTIAMPL